MSHDCLSCYFEPDWINQPIKCRRYKSVATDTQLYFKDKKVYYYNDKGEECKYDHCPSWMAKNAYGDNSFLINGQIANICDVCNTIYIGDQCNTCILCAAFMNLVESFKVLFGTVEEIKLMISNEAKVKGTKLH